MERRVFLDRAGLGERQPISASSCVVWILGKQDHPCSLVRRGTEGPEDAVSIREYARGGRVDLIHIWNVPAQ